MPRSTGHKAETSNMQLCSATVGTGRSTITRYLQRIPLFARPFMQLGQSEVHAVSTRVVRRFSTLTLASSA